MKNLLKQEKILLAVISILAIIFTSAPYFYGLLSAPAEKEYLGLHLAAGDLSVYKSYILQVKEGNILLENLYHNETPKTKMLNSFWLFAGLFAKIFHLSPFATFHILRIILIPMCLYCLYLLISFFFNNKIKRLTALLGLAFTSGLGGFLAIFLEPFSRSAEGKYNWPMDIWIAESNTFLTFYHSPHFIASLTLLILTFYFFLLSLANTNDKKNFLNKHTIFSSICALVLLSFHPFYAATIFFILPLYALLLFLREKEKAILAIKNIFLIFTASLPSIFYYGYLYFTSKEIARKSAQNICLTPNIFILIISYGIPLFLAIYAIKKIISNKQLDCKKLFLLAWFFGGFILIYLPFVFQRRLAEGLQIPIIILAVYGVFFLLDKYQKKFKNWPKETKKIILFYLFLLLASSNFYVLASGFALIYKKNPAVYISQNELAAFSFLAKNTKKTETILTNPSTSNLIPGFALRQVYAGHDIETLNFYAKKIKVEEFFRTNTNDENKKNFLKKEGIDYILHGEVEQNFGDFKPEEKKYLEKIFQKEKVEIYKVK